MDFGKKFIKVATLSLLLLGGVFAIAADGKTTIQKKEKSYTFALNDSNNQVLNIKTFPQGMNFEGIKNKIVLLSFFGKNCPPCIMEIPHLANLQKKHKKDFKIIAIHVQQPMSKTDIKTFIKEHKINYTVIDAYSKEQPEGYDFVDYVMAKTGWKGMIPFMIMFGKDGTAQKMYLGLRSEEELESDIKQLQ